jgi:hypothetical protein
MSIELILLIGFFILSILHLIVACANSKLSDTPVEKCSIQHHSTLYFQLDSMKEHLDELSEEVKTLKNKVKS